MIVRKVQMALTPRIAFIDPLVRANFQGFLMMIHCNEESFTF